MNKNMPKYYSYRHALEKIDKAIDAEFYLEAITLEESIITDRLLRLCRENGLTIPLERITLGGEINFIQQKPTMISQFQISILEELTNFWKQRCVCLHQIAKSEPDAPTMNFQEVMENAKLTAQNGKVLVRKVSNWSAKIKGKLLAGQEN